MPETPAQRAARERNLAKGNPRAYSRSSQDAAQEPPRAAQGAPRAEEATGTTTFRARLRAKGAPTPKKRSSAPRTRPRATEGTAESGLGQQADSRGGGGGGFLGGLLDGFR